jgi:calnexin
MPNPACERLSGCGPWVPPLVDNPLYKGKWVPPRIKNSKYKGESCRAVR